MGNVPPTKMEAPVISEVLEAWEHTGYLRTCTVQTHHYNHWVRTHHLFLRPRSSTDQLIHSNWQISSKPGPGWSLHNCDGLPLQARPMCKLSVLRKHTSHRTWHCLCSHACVLTPTTFRSNCTFQERSDPAEKLVDVTVCVADREKVKVNVLKNTTVNQWLQVCKQVPVFVFSAKAQKGKSVLFLTNYSNLQTPTTNKPIHSKQWSNKTI